MDLIWAIPAIVGVIGVLVLIVGFRRVGDSVTELRVQLQRLDEVRIAIAAVRAAGTDARVVADQLRDRT